ncbi:MAG: DinB family protein [Acidobacteria bacterium]|nr:MAG: DinB family protein [Acidobacteriota bacterium]
MDKNQIESLREHLLNLLSGAWAHMEFDKAVADFPPDLRGNKTQGIPYTAWQLLEHMRIAQWDILEFSRDPKHVSPDWPSGYWPQTEAPVSNSGWDESVSRFKKDLEAMRKLVESPETDLFSKIPHGTGQTILQEAMLMADHNAYHLGQLVLLRKLLAG